MTAPVRRPFRTLAAVALFAFAGTAPAQPGVKLQPQPGGAGNPGIRNGPVFRAQPVVQPSVNSHPGFPAHLFYQPAVNPGPFYNPALNNPWMNQVNVVPVGNNPCIGCFGNPFAANPLLPVGFNNPLGVPGFRNNPIAVPAAPPIAIRQPGMFMYKGPDLQVNPTTGTVYNPLSGVVTMADGTKYYRVTGSGLPTATGNYATGTGLYYNPQGGTFFNPGTGTVSKPGQTNVFLPYVW